MNRRPPRTHSSWVAGVGATLALLSTCIASADQATGPPMCSMRLSVEVTPDVPDPGDAGFISSLLGNHPSYQLFLLRRVDDTHVDLQLQGPGPAERCQDVVDSMSDDGRVASIEVK